MQTVLLAVKQTGSTIQTGDGGVEFITKADLGGSGGGSTVATVDNIVMQDTDGTLFFKRVSADTPPVLTNWKLADGSAYTITGTPVPYGVSSVEVTGTVATGGLTDTELRATAVAVADANILASIATLQATIETTNAYILADKATQMVSFITSQAVAVGATSISSAVVSGSTTRVVLTSTVDCWVHIGTAPTATLDAPSFFLAAGIPSYPFFVTSSSTKVATIAVSTAGTLSILESA